jgi:hypothetical protein
MLSTYGAYAGKDFYQGTPAWFLQAYPKDCTISKGLHHLVTFMAGKG